VATIPGSSIAVPRRFWGARASRVLVNAFRVHELLRQHDNLLTRPGVNKAVLDDVPHRYTLKLP
jgi:hypothetical protein